MRPGTPNVALGRADAAQAVARLLRGAGEQPGHHGLAGLAASCQLFSARAPLKRERSSILAQHPAGRPFLWESVCWETPVLDRKIGLCALSPAV